MSREVVGQLRRARAQLDAGDYAAAADTCQKILDEEWYCLPALRMLARSAAATGRIDVAEESFRACANIDPEDDLAHVGLALCAEARGDPEAAANEYHRALELAPTDLELVAEVNRRMGAVHRTPLMAAREAMSRGAFADAQELLGEPSDDEDLAVELTRAHAMWEMGEPQGVWDLCWRLLQKHPTCVRALHWLHRAGPLVEKPLYVRIMAKRLQQIAPDLPPFCPSIRANECASSSS
ncbi:MAG TPA: tetratricopeptide repeat protein [Chloroflexota bacterium]|nr:tetratricopeptide repeat protein [Chloroflexota bacterium]